MRIQISFRSSAGPDPVSKNNADPQPAIWYISITEYLRTELDGFSWWIRGWIRFTADTLDDKCKFYKEYFSKMLEIFVTNTDEKEK
jgi:hypothetical protein